MAFDTTTDAARVDLIVPSMTCAHCMRRVEAAMAQIDGVTAARANLSGHSVRVRYDTLRTSPETIATMLSDAGYPARPRDASVHGDATDDPAGRALVLRIGVAGFAAMNVMLLSVSVWSGAEAATRDLLHWVSALIALPALAFSAQPFFVGAFGALSAGRLNMDVPIALAILLSAMASVAQTASGGAHAYFDAGIMLTFFLLIGRYLEHRTRTRARSAAGELMAMTGRTAQVMRQDGSRSIVPVRDLLIGMRIDVAPGERIPADGRILNGETELDRALLTGESAPERAGHGGEVHAGCLNLTGPIEVVVTRTGEETLLAQIAAMVDDAAKGRGRYDRLADRIARAYAPAVHILAALAFAGWLIAGSDLWTAGMVAVAVLIVTCPCALALAVPTVHTVASAELFRRGIFLKDGAALERLAEIDHVVFDKTGTLTTAVPKLADAPSPDSMAWSVAASLASRSRHPRAVAIAEKTRDLGVAPAHLTQIRERPGLGLEAQMNGSAVRLGRPEWVTGSDGPGVAVAWPGGASSFGFREGLRTGADTMIARLTAAGIGVTLLSGDARATVAPIAQRLGIDDARGGLMPGDKARIISDMKAAGRRVMMVGDGLNDAPALAAAHASISPGDAADVAKAAADMVFTGADLNAVGDALDIARRARRRSFGSLALAFAYNAIAIPLAMAGAVTPLVAAVAMSGSSCLVVLNALRLRGRQ